jgi:cobalt-zinc-cadmium efflux system protein
MTHCHSHHHHDHSPKSAERFNWTFGIAVGLNLLFTIVQATYAIMANSMGLLADAGHNLGDVVGLLLAWGATWLLTKPSSKRYSYGYKRTTILAAITNALLLVGTSALIAYESIIKLLQPEPVSEVIVMVVAAVGIIINGGTSLLFIRGSKGDLNMKGAFLHLAADALISFGVLISAVLIFYTEKFWLDPLVGLAIVATILMGTWGLLRDSVNLLMDGVPHDIQKSEVEAYFQSIPGVIAVHDLHIWGLSTRETALTAHLVMPVLSLTDADYYHINHLLKEQFNIDHVTIQVEQGSEEHPCRLEAVC